MQLPLATLFYDTSNCFPSLDSGNERCPLAQRRHAQPKRFDLRQFRLALLVPRDGQSPLYADVYEGTLGDATRCPASLPAIRQRVERLVGQLEALPLVSAKGNNAKAQQALVDPLAVHYVASLVPPQHPELSALPTAAYPPLEAGPLAKMPGYQGRRTLWGAARTVVCFLSSQLRRGQIRGLQQQLLQRLEALQQWQQRLAKPRSGLRTPARAQQQVAALLPGHYIPHVLTITYDGQQTGAQRLAWGIDHTALAHLETEGCGKRLLITAQPDWTTEEIIVAYRGPSRAAVAFRQLQEVDHLAVRPQYHGTDQKIRVHTCLCLLALLLCRLVERESRTLGYQGSLSNLLDLLSSIRLALILRSAETPTGRPRCAWVLEESSAAAWNLYQPFVPPIPPCG